uniref:Coagulation factor II (thrombin) receptor-like 1, tandem duplicate 2 n=1 Tax=Oncorhynchus kisutch TaxID=8019 RepID=A0A8C7GIV6_ONCKI
MFFHLFIVGVNVLSPDWNMYFATAETLRSSLTTVFLPIVYIVVFAVGLPTNTMAIWVFLFRTKKKHPAVIYMANLALSDLLFVIWTPLKIAYHFNGNDWIYGERLCKVLVGFFYGNMYCSILFIPCLSIQCYWVVAHPLSHQKKNNKMAIAVSVSIWAFIWLTTTPLYLYNHTAKLKDLNITPGRTIRNNIMQDFRDHVKNTLLCRSSRTVERMRVSFSSMKYSKKSKAYVSESENTQSSTC